MLLIRDDNNSHGTVIWENLNCIDEMFLGFISDNNKHYKLIEE